MIVGAKSLFPLECKSCLLHRYLLTEEQFCVGCDSKCQTENVVESSLLLCCLCSRQNEDNKFCRFCHTCAQCGKVSRFPGVCVFCKSAFDPLAIENAIVRFRFASLDQVVWFLFCPQFDFLPNVFRPRLNEGLAQIVLAYLTD
jgi:hypothetical protein